MNFSARVKLRLPARQDGSAQVLLQVLIYRKKKVIPLGIGWFPEFFDEQASKCMDSLPKKHQDRSYEQRLNAAVVWAGGRAEVLAQRATDYNLVIGQALAKANDVFIEYRLSGRALTMKEFLHAYNTGASKKDFVAFMDAKIKDRHKKGPAHKQGISDNTKKNHISSLNALRSFRKEVPFHTLDAQFAEDFDAFLKKKIKSINTIWGRHKDVKTYLELARKARIRFENPYTDFRNKSADGQWRPLTPNELAQLEGYYQSCSTGSLHRRILCKFLFSCHSSLRLGDLKAIQDAKLDGQELTFQIQKTYHHKLREMLLPLTRKAVAYLEDSHREEGLSGFFNYSDQYSNRALKVIAAKLRIETKLHHHVGRETFATQFIRRGGKVEVLQKLMDHAKISTTMKYVHVDDNMKREAIRMLDASNEVA